MLLELMALEVSAYCEPAGHSMKKTKHCWHIPFCVRSRSIVIEPRVYAVGILSPNPKPHAPGLGHDHPQASEFASGGGVNPGLHASCLSDLKLRGILGNRHKPTKARIDPSTRHV